MAYIDYTSHTVHSTKLQPHPPAKERKLLGLSPGEVSHVLRSEHRPQRPLLTMYSNPKKDRKVWKIPRNRNFSGIQNGCTFPTRKTKQISMAISIQAPKLQVPTTKIWFNMVQYLKETKNICFLGGYGTIMVYPPLETV